MSNLTFNDQQLAPLDYTYLFQETQTELQKQAKEYLFLESGNLSFNIDTIADTIAQRLKDSNHYPFDVKDGLVSASVHALLNNKKTFSHDLKEMVVYEVRSQMLKRLTKNTSCRTLDQYATSLLTPIDDFIQDNARGLSYPIDKEHNLQKQSLHALRKAPTPGDLWLKAHKLTLRVTNIDSFTEQIVQSIEAYVKNHDGCDEDDIEDVRDSLISAQEQPNSGLNQLKEIVLAESVARIQREASVRYLRYLAGGIQERRKKKRSNDEKLDTAVLLLGNLIRRLQGLDAYIRQPGKANSDYAVYIHKLDFNYRDLFARADAFNALPIIPEIDGFLGENTDVNQHTKTFTSGVKIKLNGSVNNHGASKGHSVFDFNVALLDPETPEYQHRKRAARSERIFYEKVLKVALLYCFVFVDMEKRDFRGGVYFEKELLPALQSNDDQQVIKALQKLKTTITQQSTQDNLIILRDTIIDFLRTSPIGPEKQEYSLALVLDRGILTKDINQIIQGNFFQDPFDGQNRRKALKYLAVTPDAPDTETLSKLPLTMTFEPIYYAPTTHQADHVTMYAATEGIQVLPTFLAPVDNKAPQKYKGVYENVSRIAFYYQHRDNVPGDSARAFVYRFVYTLLAYTTIKLLADSLPEQQRRTLFTPIVCIHARAEQLADEKGEKYDDETFMHSLSKQLAHMLGEDYISGSQGFNIETIRIADTSPNGNTSLSDKDLKIARSKLGNALYSLYSVLPHTFKIQNSADITDNTIGEAKSTPSYRLPKLAIIIISSRKCDENTNSPDSYLSTIIGKVSGIERNPDGTVTVQTLNTFSANQNSLELYQRPDIIIEQVKKYHLQGYKHFLYIAHAPYSSTLNISNSNDQDLFFMNKDIIQAMRSIDDEIKIYPAFYDKYFVINRKFITQQSKLPPAKRKGRSLQPDSLFIDDIRELTLVSNDPSRRSQLFLNLFNGIKVKPEAVYSGVMSYATLINVYDNDPSYDQYIWNDLLSATPSDDLKAELLDFIALLHFSRYEKESSPIGFKLDPYTDIIGNSSVGARSIFPHMNDGVARFNALAFLTVVRAVMQAEE